jgi:uncharacterized protein (TIGR03083 family)
MGTNDVDDLGEPIEALEAEPRAAEVLGLAVAGAPRPLLRDRVLAAATAARAPGRPAGGVIALSPIEAFRATVDELDGLVDELTDADSTRPSIEGWNVAGLLGHLTAIEDHFGAVLGWWPETGPVEDELDHLEMTIPAARAAQAQPFGTTVAAWREVVGRVLARIDSLAPRLTERVFFHGFDFSIRSLVIARTFEVWTHTEDICRAVGRAPFELDPARLRMMCDAAVGALPLGMLLTGGDPQGRTARIVLEGPGGGTWVQALELGAEAGEPSTTVIADAIDFCRVAAKRRSPSDLVCTLLGDVDLALRTLTAAAVFAA